jgi:hypothetical protein
MPPNLFKLYTSSDIVMMIKTVDINCACMVHVKMGKEYATLEYEGISRSFRTGHLERQLQTVQLSATRCSCIVIL